MNIRKATSPLEQNRIRFVSFRFVLRLSGKRLTINSTTHTFLERSRKDLSENIWVVALIVNRFKDKRKKQNETKMILLKWGLSFTVTYGSQIYLVGIFLLVFLNLCNAIQKSILSLSKSI